MTASTSYPVAMIPYVNMAPYRQMGVPPQCRFVPLVPRESIAALAEGRVVAAAVPVGGLPLLHDIVEPLGKFGIAAKEESMSVMFFSDRPFDEFDSDSSIRLSGDSASSVRLLYLLWARMIGIDNLPGLAAPDEPVNGELLIGDQALKRAVRLIDWGPCQSTGTAKPTDDPLPVVTDLATVWRKTRGLPFVFARWVVRRDAAPEVKQVLVRWLEDFRRQEAVAVEGCTAPAAGILGIDTAVAQRYFQMIHRCLDDADILGQERFITEFSKLKREPLFRPFAGRHGV